jgi:hypothetical protein
MVGSDGRNSQVGLLEAGRVAVARGPDAGTPSQVPYEVAEDTARAARNCMGVREHRRKPIGLPRDTQPNLRQNFCDVDDGRDRSDAEGRTRGRADASMRLAREALRVGEVTRTAAP